MHLRSLPFIFSYPYFSSLQLSNEFLHLSRATIYDALMLRSSCIVTMMLRLCSQLPGGIREYSVDECVYWRLLRELFLTSCNTIHFTFRGLFDLVFSSVYRLPSHFIPYPLILACAFLFDLIVLLFPPRSSLVLINTRSIPSLNYNDSLFVP